MAWMLRTATAIGSVETAEAMRAAMTTPISYS
jgi:hypothetical protein